jgi:archaellin
LNNQSKEYTAGTEASTFPAGNTAYNYNYEITGTGNRSGYIVPGDLVTLTFNSPRVVYEDEDFRITVSPKTGSITQIYGSTPEIMTTSKVYLFP